MEIIHSEFHNIHEISGELTAQIRNRESLARDTSSKRTTCFRELKNRDCLNRDSIALSQYIVLTSVRLNFFGLYIFLFMTEHEGFFIIFYVMNKSADYVDEHLCYYCSYAAVQE